MPYRIKILLVEDDKIAQKIAFYALSQFDCSVDIADDGMQALQKVEKTQYDLILTDLGLPNSLDGFALTQAIREIHSYKKIPIVAITAHIEDIYRDRASEVGLDDIFVKPLDRKTIETLFERLGIAENNACPL